MPRRRGGTRPAWPAAPTSTPSSRRAAISEPVRADRRRRRRARVARRRARLRRRLSGPRLELLPPAGQRNTAASLYRRAAPPADKIEERADVRLRSLVLNQFGATIGQSIGDHLVVGSTLKLVHGGVGVAARRPATASLDAAAALDALRRDARATSTSAPWPCSAGARSALTVRNVTRADVRQRARRVHARAPGARGRGADARARAASSAALTLAVDADLTTTPTRARRRAARGGASRRGCSARRSACAAGVSANTIGDARTVGERRASASR